MVEGDGRVKPMVSDRLPTPLYHQIYLILRHKIIDHTYRDGALLPSEKETAETYGVSRITAKRALNELAVDGLVVRERGRGTKVTHQEAITPLAANVEGMLENLMAMGLETEIDLLEFDYATPGLDAVSALACADDDVVQRSVRIRKLDGTPFSYLVTYVPEVIGKTYTREDLATTTLLTLLERGGVEVLHAEQTLTATLADAIVAPLLGVEVNAPLLRIERVVYDQADRAVEYIIGLYRPDIYKYRLNLSRVQSDEKETSWSPTR